MGGMEPTRQSETPGLPRWVKVSGIIASVVVLLLVLMLLVGSVFPGVIPGDHGPMRHLG